MTKTQDCCTVLFGYDGAVILAGYFIFPYFFFHPCRLSLIVTYAGEIANLTVPPLLGWLVGKSEGW